MIAVVDVNRAIARAIQVSERRRKGCVALAQAVKLPEP